MHPSIIAAYLEQGLGSDPLRTVREWAPSSLRPPALAWLLPVVLLTTALLADAAGRLAVDTDEAATDAPVIAACEPQAAVGGSCGSRRAVASADERHTRPDGHGATLAPALASFDSTARSHVRELSHRIERGETISQVLDWAGVKPDQIDEWVRAANAVYDLNRIYVGQEVSLLVDTQSSTLRHMALEIDPVHRLVAEREDSRVVARRQPIRHDRHLRVRTATIRTNLYAAGLTAGVPEDIISDMAELFGWELNLSRDLQPGASFRVIYEEISRANGSVPLSTTLLAAEITNRGRTHEVFHFSGSNGKDSGYYTRNGESLGSTFLRYPVAFHRITSGFTSRRFHPVLKRPVPHNGVDFAAPHGTPVKAIADGTVREARWSGGHGRFVRIRHGAIYESGYAHLSRFASGVRSGTRVTKGQVIGYVGATGLATGPHLHFAMYRNGKYINPLTTQLPRAKALSGTALAAFRTAVDDFDLAYAQARIIPEYAQVAAVSIPD